MDILPTDGSEWVNLLVREMMSVSNIDDTKTCNSRVLGMLEKHITTNTNSEAIHTLGQENTVLKEQKEIILQENIILKRAIVIQQEHLKKHDEQNEELQQLKQLVCRYQEQTKKIEDDDEADIVGCCTLKVENVMLVPINKLQFNFLGKDYIIYFNTVEVKLGVYKAIGDFRTVSKVRSKKAGGDDLFDMFDTSKLNAHRKEILPGLIAEVFRTYNTSIT